MGFLGTGTGFSPVRPRLQALLLAGSAQRCCDQQVEGKLQLDKVKTWIS